MCEMCSELIAFLLVFFVVTFEQISHTSVLPNIDFEQLHAGWATLSCEPAVLTIAPLWLLGKSKISFLFFRSSALLIPP